MNCYYCAKETEGDRKFCDQDCANNMTSFARRFVIGLIEKGIFTPVGEGNYETHFAPYLRGADKHSEE